MKRIVLLILVVISLFVITGCSKGPKTADNKTEYICKKNNIAQTDMYGNKYTVDNKYYAKLDESDKLVKYSYSATQHYEDKAVCNSSCEIITDWNNEIIEKNYTGFVRSTKCDCSNGDITQVTEYAIATLDKYLRVDISELNEDNTFNLDKWISKFEKVGYNCN